MLENEFIRCADISHKRVPTIHICYIRLLGITFLDLAIRRDPPMGRRTDSGARSRQPSDPPLEIPSELSMLKGQEHERPPRTFVPGASSGLLEQVGGLAVGVQGLMEGLWWRVGGPKQEGSLSREGVSLATGSSGGRVVW